MITIDPAAIYKSWPKLPTSKLRLHDATGGIENVWVKEVTSTLVGIDTPPLTDGYRWHDIVQRDGTTHPPVIHRRWNAKVWFRYKAASTEVADFKNRQKLLDQLTPIGHPTFMISGLGFVLLEQQVGALSRVQDALRSLSIVTAVEQAAVGMNVQLRE